MKNELLLFITYLLFTFTMSAQDNLSGHYYADSGIYLKIEDESFKLIMPDNARNGWYSEIMAEGVIKQIDNSFIELNTNQDPISEV